MDLVGKTAVVTGAASGIGQALAIEAAQRGARIAAADLVPVRETVEAIRAADGEAESFVCDIADPDSVARLVDAVEQRFGVVHALAANAGVGTQGSLEECSVEDFGFVMRVNVFGTFYCIRAFAPLLRRAADQTGSASVMITGSEHSLGVPPGQFSAVYTTSKHALLGLADMGRSSFADSGVSVTLLCPGWTLVPKVAAYLDANPESTSSFSATAQTPAVVADRAWSAAEAGQFLAPTNPASRDLAMSRVQEIEGAFDALGALSAPE